MGGEEECSVCVAVHVRPLISQELEDGCKECLVLTPGEPQVSTGPHSFTFDHVFGSDGGEPASQLFDKCVAPLVDGLFKGYNATVFAYGQTGSGKTYTMGSSFHPGYSSDGVIPRAMDAIFGRVARSQDTALTIRVGFVEIHREDIKDLLVTDAAPHTQVHIREVAGGGVCLAGANEREVRTKEEMVELLQQGTLLRATAATGMNKRSSRSHAIFTITLEQRRLVAPAGSEARRGGGGSSGGGSEESGDEGEEESESEEEADDSYLCAKLHLVDLAGSERAKRTKAVGQRLQEGININKGLLALGNVICALSEGKQHVPYRDSKLTRMLQDSLGGNSRTVMVACVSPADVNLEESLNTLRYANRARNIRNKPVVNRDPVAAQIALLRSQLAAAKAENQSLKRKLGIADGAPVVDSLFSLGGPDTVMAAALDELEQRNKKLEMENNRLHVEADSLKQDLTETTEKMIVAQAQREKLSQKLEQVDPTAAEELRTSLTSLSGAAGGPGGDEVVSHLQRIAELEREVKRLRQVTRVSGAFVMNSRRQSLALDAAGAMPGSPGFALGHPPADDDCLSDMELNDDEFAAEEQAHRHEMTRVQAQIAALQQQLEEKEARMQVVGSHALLKQAYDKHLRELQLEVDELQKERLELVQKLQSLSHASEEERLRMESQYKGRLKDMDDKIKSLRSKEKRILELERIKGKADETCKRLQTDIQNIKQQKVTLTKQMEARAKEFGEWKKQRDKELLQLRKQGRANAAQLQKMEALHAKQQAVLRRKTEEAEAARKRLKEMEQRRSQAVSRPTTATSTSSGATTDRPTTAPASAVIASVPARPAAPQPPPVVERSISTPAAATTTNDVDCQPNQMAPLLRDEKSRREWVERELDACCASYDLQRVLEGEKALRSECARKLRDVEKKLAALNPLTAGWWPASASPGAQSEQLLLRQKAELNRQLDAHSKQIQEYQMALMKAKQSEEERGGGAADARRWNGLRTIVEARSLLKTVFRSASQHKAQAYEAQVQLTEATEEVELLRLRLDIAEQEKLESANQAAKAQAAAVAAVAVSTSSVSPQRPLAPAPAKDDTDALADTLIQQLDAMPSNLLETIPEEPGSGSEGWDEDEEDGESENESSSEEEGDAWDPSTATPFAKGRKKGAQGEGAQRRRSTGARRSASVSTPTCPEEQPVLNFINEERLRAGEEAVSKLTVPLLKHHLKGKLVGGQEWRAGSKKREALIKDFREYLGLREVEPTSPHPDAFELQPLGRQAWGQPSRRPPWQGTDAATPSAASAGSTPLGQRPSSTTPLGADGDTPDTMPPTARQHGLVASPAAEGRGRSGALPRLSIPPAEGQEPGGSPSGKPGSGRSGSSSPMQRLLAGINPFARHSRSRSDLPLARLGGSSGGGGGASGGGRSQPATPSDSTVDAAALLERSAACLQRAAEIKTAMHTTIAKTGRPGVSGDASGSGSVGNEAAGGGSPRGATPGSPASARSSPSRTLLSWMGLKGRGGSTTPEGGAGAVSLTADATSGGAAAAATAAAAASPRPLGSSNRSSSAGAAGSSDERENLHGRGAGGCAAAVAAGAAAAATARAPTGHKVGVPKLVGKAGLERLQPASDSSSPVKAGGRSEPNSARSDSRVWK